MEVYTTQPFELIYAIVEDKHLGYIIEPHVVQVNSKGHLTLSHQRLFGNTWQSFSKKIDEHDAQIIRILDDLTDEAVFKKFYIPASNRKKVKPAEYYAKQVTPEFFQETIRPYIEKRLAQVIPLLVGKSVFLAGTNGNPAATPIQLPEEPSTILFHFRRNELHTRYFATIKYQGNKIEFMQKQSILLTLQPCWLLVDDKMYTFEEFVDGKKLKPFLTRRFIEIPKKTEDKYFHEFVRPLLERFDVYAEGFNIVTEQARAKPCLSLQSWGDALMLNLSFDYGGHVFHYHQGKRVHVWIEKKGDQYTFHRVRRSRQWEAGRVQFLEEQGLQLKEGSLFHLEGNESISLITWLNDHLEILQSQEFRIEQKLQHTYFLGKQVFHFEIEEQRDWFDVHAVAKFGEFEIPLVRLKDHILKGIREFVLPDGNIAVIPESWFPLYSGLLEYAHMEGDRLQVKRMHVGLLETLWSNEEARRTKWAGKLKLMDQVNTPPEIELPLAFKAELRPYQREGYYWFWFLLNHGFGGILADDMGLGKTVQVLCLFQGLKEEDLSQQLLQSARTPKPILSSALPAAQLDLFSTGAIHVEVSEETPVKTETKSTPSSPCLVVAPTSLIYNWLNEAKRFTPGLRILVHAGQQRGKSYLPFLNYDVVITTYGTLRSDEDIFKELEFKYVVLDESQAIKNAHSQTARSVMKLRARHRLVLTGTPIENSIIDLWSQMNFVNPGLLGSYQGFMDKFVIPVEKNKDPVQTARLQALVKPFILRRTKKMVASDLPEKSEQVRMCEMHEEQAKLYESVKSFYRNQILQSVAEKTFTKNKISIFQGLSKLRQIANHPLMTEEGYIGGSGKFDEVTRLAKTVIEEGHKIIMFSQFVKHLDLYKTNFDQEGISYLSLDGSTPAAERKRLVDEFQDDASIKIFLISLKAGGFGLNLTAADYVFLLDPWWNPAVEKQAQDRSHRIGQDKKVIIYKFITRDSIEEKILALQEKKNELAENIIVSDDQAIRKISAEDLLDLIS